MRRAKTNWYKYLGWAQLGLGTVAAATSAALKVDTPTLRTNVGPAVADIVAFSQQWAWIGVPSLLALAWIAGAAKRKYGDPSTWNLVHELLDDFRNKVFSDAGSAYQHHHRVTLFKHVRWNWTWSDPFCGWLKAVERSGHTSQSSKRQFRAPDDSDKCEGVCGLAWVATSALRIDQLPNLNGVTEDKIFEAYAQKTGMTLNQVREHPPQGRSFYAVRVEVKGKPWGVIVIDSRSQTIHWGRVNSHYGVMGKYFGRILERA